MMKTTLFLSTFAAGLLAVASTTFAQNFVNYPLAAGTAGANATATRSDIAPVDRFTRSDLGYQSSVNPPRSKTAHARSPAQAQK